MTEMIAAVIRTTNSQAKGISIGWRRWRASARPIKRKRGAARVPNPNPADRMVTRGRGSIDRTSRGTTIAWNGIGRPSRPEDGAETRVGELAAIAMTPLATSRRSTAIGPLVAGAPGFNLIHHE